MRARKRFGQHFLSPEWSRQVIDAIAPAGDDIFLEIGAGRGALTWLLAERAAQVVAVEVDRDLGAELQREAPPNVTVVIGDVLDVDLAGLLRAQAGQGRLRAAGNLPYNISSPILFRLLDAYRRTGAPVDASVMLQREVVERLAASPGSKDYGVLTVLTRLHADVEMLLRLPPGAFRPAPKVRSALARLTFRQPAMTVADPARFEAVVKSLFSQRRKTILNAVRRLCADPADAPRVLETAGIAPARRPETLDLPELAALVELLGSSGRRAVL